MSQGSHSQNMARNTRKTIDEVREAGESIKETIQDRASNVVQSVQKVGADAGAAVKEQYENVRDTAADYYKQGRRRARQMEKSFEDTVQERPVVSILVALGAGFLIGLLCRRS